MKKLLIILCVACMGIPIGILVSPPVCADSPANTVNTKNGYLEQKVSNLSDRFTSIESTWGHFQIGGNFLIGASTIIDPADTSKDLKLNQRLDLYLNALIDPHTRLSVKLLHPGIWGSAGYPLLASPQIDEAYLQIEYPRNIDYIGRFRFSLGPIGLISDFMADSPLEGIVIQQNFNKIRLMGLYSPIYSDLGEDYFATRIGWSDQSSSIGLNLVPNGIAGEKNVSIDYSGSYSNSNIFSELGWYSFESTQDPSLNVTWTPAFLIGFSRQLPSKNYFQIKAGYLSPKFKPSYSSLAHSSGDSREWFLPNSKGVELSLQTELRNSLLLNNRLAVLMPVENFNQPDISYHLLSSFTKRLSPVNQIDAGVNLKTMTESAISTQLFVSWNLQF